MDCSFENTRLKFLCDSSRHCQTMDSNWPLPRSPNGRSSTTMKFPRETIQVYRSMDKSDGDIIAETVVRVAVSRQYST